MLPPSTSTLQSYATILPTFVVVVVVWRCVRMHRSRVFFLGFTYVASTHGRFAWNESPLTRADLDSKLISILRTLVSGLRCVLTQKYNVILRVNAPRRFVGCSSRWTTRHLLSRSGSIVNGRCNASGWLAAIAVRTHSNAPRRLETFCCDRSEYHLFVSDFGLV